MKHIALSFVAVFLCSCATRNTVAPIEIKYIIDDKYFYVESASGDKAYLIMKEGVVMVNMGSNIEMEINGGGLVRWKLQGDLTIDYADGDHVLWRNGDIITPVNLGKIVKVK